MALAPVRLDDLTWTDMVESIRRRIAGASDGEWTHHGPVDPGITLLELFAWLIEQRLFWIDQVPDDLMRALFALAGERPRDAVAAATVLSCTAPNGPAFLSVPAGVAFTFASVEAPRIFTSRTGTVIAPIERASVVTADGDRSSELATHRPVALMRNDKGASEFVILLWLRHAGPIPSASEPLGLLFDLDTSNRIDPEWIPGAREDTPTPAQLVWSYSVAGGGWRDFESVAVTDGTGGLRRSGVVRVPLRTDWSPRGSASGGLTPFALRARTARATFTAPPRLAGISWNAVIADHWSTVTANPQQLASQAAQWLKQAGQTLQLPDNAPPPIAGSVTLKLRERDGSYDWQPVTDFAFGDSERRVFVVDRSKATIQFGDGLSARIPVPHDRRNADIAVVYRAGGGTAGSVGVGKPWAATSAGAAIDARNPVTADGGAEAETLAEAARRIGSALARNQRAVTRSDFEELALATPGVAIARALAIMGLHPLHPCVRIPGAVSVFIVPFAPRADALSWTSPDPSRVDAPLPDPGALAAVQAHLDAARLLGTQVFVQPVTYRPVSVRVVLSASPADVEDIESRLRARLSRFLDPLSGGDKGEGLPFGEAIRPSALLRIAQEVLRGEAVVEQVLIGVDGAAPSEACQEIAIRPQELSYLARFEATYQPSPTAGGLP